MFPWLQSRSQEPGASYQVVVVGNSVKWDRDSGEHKDLFHPRMYEAKHARSWLWEAAWFCGW